jgi:uncharacterized protein
MTTSLKDRINDDIKAAMRAKESDKLTTIRMLTAAIKQREVDERITLDEAGVIAIVDKLIKQRKDSIAAFEQAGRQELADKEKAEIAILAVYQPERLSAEAVAAEVNAIVAELATSLGHKPTAADMGKVMGAAKAKLAGKADMGAVNAAVKAALAS